MLSSSSQLGTTLQAANNIAQDHLSHTKRSHILKENKEVVHELGHQRGKNRFTSGLSPSNRNKIASMASSIPRSEQLSAATRKSQFFSSVQGSIVKNVKNTVEQGPIHLRTNASTVVDRDTDATNTSAKKRKLCSFASTFIQTPEAYSKRSNDGYRETVTPWSMSNSRWEENKDLRRLDFGPTFLQRKCRKDDDELEEKYASMSPRLSGTPSEESVRNSSEARTPLVSMMNALRRRNEEDCIRFKSSSFQLPAIESHLKRSGKDLNDPRTRASMHLDVTLLHHEDMKWSGEKKQIVYLCYVHSLVYHPKPSTRPGKGNIYSSLPSRFDPRNSTLALDWKDQVVATTAWICFPEDVLKYMRVSIGCCLRIYDAIIVPISYRFLELRTKQGVDSDCCSMILSSNMCESCPDDVPTLPVDIMANLLEPPTGSVEIF